MVSRSSVWNVRTGTSLRDRIAASPLRIVEQDLRRFSEADVEIVESDDARSGGSVGVVAAERVVPDDVCAVHHRALSYYEMMDGKRCSWCRDGINPGRRDDDVVQGKRK